jgi:hypothetical protein
MEVKFWILTKDERVQFVEVDVSGVHPFGYVKL